MDRNRNQIGIISDDPRNPGQIIGPGGRSTGSGYTAAPTSYGTASAPTAGSMTSGSPSSGMSPYTGFASRYMPGQLDATIYDNPWYILADVYNGIKTSSPGYQMLRDFGADPLALYNIATGGSGTIDGGASDFTNFMANLYQNLGTVGGQGFDVRELLSNIFNAREGSSLDNILSAGDMNTQVRTLFNLLRDVSNVGMNPLAARGYQAAVARAGDEYGNQMLKRDAGNMPQISDWIAQNAPHLTVR